ncbi:MAG: hypothetical protein ABW360_06830 [Phenylobacterium sp.]
MKRTMTLALAIALALAGVTSAFAAAPADAVILLEMAPLPGDGDPKLAATLRPTITAFDPATSALKSPYLGRWIGPVSAGGDRPTGLVWGAKVKPGAYTLSGLAAQTYWNACFDKAAVVFDVAPGAVVYVGQFDPRPTLVEMAAGLPRSSRNFEFLYLSAAQPARLTPPAEVPDWQSRIAPVLAAAFPTAMSAPEAAAIRVASFKRRRSLLGPLSC